MDQAKIIEKLFKIASQQQKIINKIGQAVGVVPPEQHGASDVWTDITPQVAEIMKSIPGANPGNVHVIHVVVSSNGEVDGRLSIPVAALGTSQFKQLKDELVAQLSGKTIDVGGKQVAISNDPGAINFISVAG